MLRRLIYALAAVLCLAAAPALAEEGEHPEPHAFGFEGPLGVYDMGAVQRGFLVYKQVCAACHSMNHLSYRNLGEPGGPFAAYRVRNHETGEFEIHIGPQGHGGTLLGINDNPFVRQIASEVMITEIDHSSGLESERPGRISDHFHRPFANEFMARAANGGALPPDLSVITSARHGGAEYVRSLMLGYVDPPPAGAEVVEGKYYNRYFPGHWIAMPPPLAFDGVVEYSDGTEATSAQMATDVATFLQWAADPHMEARKKLGMQAIAFLLVLSLLMYLAYKQVWRGQKH
jgi:ubiquinol-cytochrome c reductase cytochrome c1 subunit